MSGYTKFDSEIYSEELYSVSEADYDEVMAAPAVDNDWEGYGEWSDSLQAQMAESENLYVEDGKVFHKPEPKSLGRIGGVEL
jgi:hypothetical protein